MKKSNHTKKALILGVLMFFAGLIGQQVAHGYIHPADPIVLLGAMLLPLPHALVVAAVSGAAVDLLKGLYLLAPVTLIVRVAMVLAAVGLLKTRPAEKHPELMVSLAAVLPVPLYYLAETVNLLIRGKGIAAFGIATVTLRADLVQAFASILLFIFIYDIYKGIRSAREEMRKSKQEKEEENAE